MVCTNAVHGHRRQLLKCPFSDLCVFTVLILSKISLYCKHNSVNKTQIQTLSSHSLSSGHAATSFHTNRLVCISNDISFGEIVGG